jgi:hypothetical protein
MGYSFGSRKLWRVLVWGEVEESPDDKLCGTHRQYLEWVIVTEELDLTYNEYKNKEFNAKVNRLFAQKGHRWPKKGEIK